MAVLCCELLSSSLSKPDLVTEAVARFAGAFSTTLVDSWDQPSQQVIERLCTYVRRIWVCTCPIYMLLPFALCQVFVVCFHTTKLNGNYKKAMSILDRALIDTYPPFPSRESQPILGRNLQSSCVAYRKLIQLVQVPRVFRGHNFLHLCLSWLNIAWRSQAY